MKTFELPGDGERYQTTIREDGFRSTDADDVRPLYRWEINTGAGRFVSTGGSMTLPGEPGTDHDLDDAWRRLSTWLAGDGKALAEQGEKARCAYSWIGSEREFLAESWTRWDLVNNPLEQVVAG